jgi:uncharacterized CHY-type Zn-finger protein
MNNLTPNVVTISWCYDFENGNIPQVILKKAEYSKSIVVQSFIFGKKLVKAKFEEYIKTCEKENLQDTEQVFFFTCLPDVCFKNLGDFFFFGCIHYLRGCKIQCSNCEKFYPCRVCHDEEEDHPLERRDVEYVFCYVCKQIVPFGKECKNCNVEFGDYCCDECRLIIATPYHNTYHCSKCFLFF